MGEGDFLGFFMSWKVGSLEYFLYLCRHEI